jgi:hypothetical protein
MASADIHRIGEVIEASTQGFTAQCYELYDAPTLGSIVRAGDPTVYAVVSDIRTQGLDPSRPVTARGQDATSEEEVYQQNPQLAQLLATRFESLAIGYSQDGAISPGYPPQPPRIHAFVHRSSEEDLSRLMASPDFLHLLVANPLANDEVIAAALRQASKHLSEGSEFLVRAGKALAVEFSGQMPRLNSILRRLS